MHSNTDHFKNHLELQIGDEVEFRKMTLDPHEDLQMIRPLTVSSIDEYGWFQVLSSSNNNRQFTRRLFHGSQIKTDKNHRQLMRPYLHTGDRVYIGDYKCRLGKQLSNGYFTVWASDGSWVDVIHPEYINTPSRNSIMNQVCTIFCVHSRNSKTPKRLRNKKPKSVVLV
jgi:hypothetical protein